MHLANGWSVGGRTRHVDVKMHFLRELKDQGLLVIKFVPGADNETGSLFLSYALINHSCSPNVFMDLTFGKETTGELRALRDKSTIVPVN